MGLDRVVLAPQDTSLVPDSGPTVASRTAMIVGRLIQEAAIELRERAQREPLPLRVEKTYIQPDSIHWDDSTYRGDAYPVYAWSCTIADVDVEMATGVWSRFMGLMGRRELPSGRGIFIRPCSSIHMFFMRFAIDAVFMDADGVVLRIYPGIKPWRVTRVVRKAKSCLEIPAGVTAQVGLSVGDRLQITFSGPPAGGAGPWRR